jgi:hypothetical protein
MIDQEQPPNWVAERAACRIDLMFDALWQIVERDVADFNKLLPNLRCRRTASVARNGDGTCPMIRVYRAEEGGAESTLTYTLHDTTITIKHHGKKDNRIGVAWDPDTHFCLLADKETEELFKVWQLSERSLEPFLFG